MASLSRFLCATMLALAPLSPALSDNGWSETLRGNELKLGSAKKVYEETFDRDLSLDGPILWAKQHDNVGLEKFDRAGGYAYKIDGGRLSLRAYEDHSGIHSGNVQSTSSRQAYQGGTIVPGKAGFVCAGCVWEARIRFPNAFGTWGAFWLLSVDSPKRRGHMEVDVIEYYGKADKRGHHHATHMWDSVTQPKAVQLNDYTGMDEIADFGWHDYAVDLRGLAKLDGKPALVIYFDGKEVGRLAATPKFFADPFYYLLTLQINPRDKERTLPQQMDIDHVRVWK